MEGTQGLLDAIVTGRRDSVPVVELPIDAGPCAVEHPLHNTRCIGNIAAESLEHGALGIIIHGVGAVHIVLQRFCFSAEQAFLGLHLVGGRVHIGGRCGAVVRPVLSHGPELVLAHHLAKALHLRQVQTGAGFGVEAESAAALRINIPVVGTHILVGAFHLHAGRAGQAGKSLGRADVGPIFKLLIQSQVLLLQALVGNAVAAGEPADEGRVVAQTDYLVMEITHGQGLGTGVVDAAIAVGLGQTAVVFPLPLAAPAHHGQNAHTVAEVVDFVILAPDILETDAVEPHVAHQVHLGLQALGRVLEQEIVRPAASLDKDLLAVQDKLTMTGGIHDALDFADAEVHTLLMAHLAALFKGNVQVIHLRRAHFTGPPDTGVIHRLYHFHQPAAARGNLHVGHKAAAVIDTFHLALHRFGAQVHQGGDNLQLGAGKVGRVHNGLHKYVLHLNVRGGNQTHGADDAHALVQGAGVPVGKAVVQVPFLGAAHRHFKGVGGLGKLRHVKLAHAEGAEGGVGRGYLNAVQFHVGIEIQALETEDMVQALLRLEVRGIHPGRVKRRAVQLFVAVQIQDVFSQGARLVKGTGHRTGNGNIVFHRGALLLESPLFQAFALAAAAGRKKDKGKEHQKAEDAGSARVGSKYHSFSSVISSWEGCSGHSPPECPWRLYFGQWRTGPSWPIRPWPCHPRRLWLSSIYPDGCAASQPLRWGCSG